MAAIMKCFYCEEPHKVLTRTTPKGMPPQWACPNCLGDIETPSLVEEERNAICLIIDEMVKWERLDSALRPFASKIKKAIHDRGNI